jgi:hypothetical protein
MFRLLGLTWPLIPLRRRSGVSKKLWLARAYVCLMGLIPVTRTTRPFGSVRLGASVD